jgi:uncharacterized repeat protein (TIGR03803 family)
MKSTFFLFVSLTICISLPAEAQTITVLHSFPRDCPWGDLTLSSDGSTLYGMTCNGGENLWGTTFSIPTSGGSATTLLNFNGNNGFCPCGNLTLSGSILYGMTFAGGANDKGNIFSIPASGGSLTTLFNFDGTHGSHTYGSLTLGDSTLYGMTFEGGSKNKGTIFSIPTSGGTPTTLFNFDGTHGSQPFGNNLTLSGSTLYGMTTWGGTSNLGTIFSIPTTGGTPTMLYNFDGMQGDCPSGSLTISGSTLYGMTHYGGTNGMGVIFSIPMSGGTPTTLFNFDKLHGSYPLGSLTLSSDGSTLFGMSGAGGTNDMGTIFSISVGGGTPTTLFNFDQTNGSYPNGSLTLSADCSTLFGMTLRGGDYDAGVVFALSIPEPSTFVLLSIAVISSIAFILRRAA